MNETNDQSLFWRPESVLLNSCSVHFYPEFLLIMAQLCL